MQEKLERRKKERKKRGRINDERGKKTDSEAESCG